MVIQLLVAVAPAFPSYTATTTPGCPPLEVQGTVPADGAVVPADVVFRALLDPAYEGCYAPILELVDADTFAPVPGVVERSAPGLWRLTPVEPLAAGGRYTFRVSDEVYGLGEEQVTVTVGDVAAPSTDAPELSIEARYECEDVRVQASVHVRTAEPVTGLLDLDYLVDGELWPVFVPVAGQTSLVDTTALPLGTSVCVLARLEDLSGALVWVTDLTCAPEDTCPTYGPPVDVAYAMEAVCDGAEASTRLVVDIDLPSGDPDTTGLLVLEVTTDLAQDARWERPVTGADGDQHAEITVLGGHDACFDVVMFSFASGEEVWRDGPYCESVTCPGEARDPDAARGCGCAGAPGGAGWLALGLVLLVRRRR